MVDALAGEEGMISQQDKDAISDWLRFGQGNTAIAANLSGIYAGSSETIILETGEEADYFAFQDYFEIDLLNKFNTKHTYSWETVASILRGLWQQGLSGFGQGQPALKAALPAEKPPEFTTTVEAIYPAEKNNLPFDVVIEKLHTEPTEQTKKQVFDIGDIIQIGNDEDIPEYRIITTKKIAPDISGLPVQMYGFDAFWDRELQHFKFCNTEPLPSKKPVKIIGRVKDAVTDKRNHLAKNLPISRSPMITWAWGAQRPTIK